MNQNKEQDFLDSPEFEGLITSLNRIYEEHGRLLVHDPANAPMMSSAMEYQLECIKTFIREKMKVKECVSCDEHKPCHNICTECAVKLGKENIVFPTEQEIEKQFQDVSDSKSQFGEIHEAERKGARWAIKFIKEKN